MRCDVITRVAGTWLAIATSLLLMSAGQEVQAQKLVTVGVLSPRESRSPASDVFDRTLQELGWVLGRTIAIEYRFSAGRGEVDAKNVSELTSRPRISSERPHMRTCSPAQRTAAERSMAAMVSGNDALLVDFRL